MLDDAHDQNGNAIVTGPRGRRRRHERVPRITGVGHPKAAWPRYSSAITGKPSIPLKSLSRLTNVAPRATAVAATHRSFSSNEAALLPSQLEGCVHVPRPFREWLAADRSQKLTPGLFQLGAPSSWRNSCNAEKYFASNYRKGPLSSNR